MKRKTDTFASYHVIQLDASDCGVACLKSILRFYGADASFEKLRSLSGTTAQGTTLLGLYQACKELGLEAEGYSAAIQDLKEVQEPCILHVILDQKTQHFIICYAFDAQKDRFLIGDPSSANVKEITPDELSEIWRTSALLLVRPSPSLTTSRKIGENKIKWLYKLIADDKNILAFSLIFGIAVAALGLSVAVFSQKLIDVIIPSGDLTKLFVSIFLLFVLLFAKLLFNYIRSLMLIRQGQDFNIRTLDAFFSHLLYLPKSFFDSRRTGDLIARMNDTQRIQRTISSVISQTTIDILMGIVALTAIFIYNWKIGLFQLCWFPFFLIIYKKYRPKITEKQEGSMKQYSLTESQFIESIQGIGEIKRKNRQSIFFETTQNIYRRLHQIGHDLSLVNTQYKSVIEILNNIFLLFLLCWISTMVIKGYSTVGELIAILQFLGMITGATISIAQLTINFEEAQVAFDRMFEFTSINSEYNPVTDPPKEKIEKINELNIHNLIFRFPGRTTLFNGLSLTVKKGEWIAIFGESGCGKSTLLQLLQKFYLKEEGSLLVNNIDLDQLDFENWRSKIGVLPQEIKLFNGNVIDNILLGQTPENPAQLELFLTKLGFDDYFRRFPNGYATILGESGINISGGQKQLIGLARALLHQPELLLLDEPTASLDRDTEKFVLDLLQNLKNDLAIILLTHQPQIGRKADRIYIIENGAISHQGNHVELLQSENLYAKTWADFHGEEFFKMKTFNNNL